MKKAFITIFAILLLDQVLKIWIKTHMHLGQEIPVLGNWFILHFTENNGMAFGFQIAGNFGKLLLSIIRILAVTAIGWYLLTLIKKEVSYQAVIGVSMILAGALGNILDSAFYGLLFTESTYFRVAEILGEAGGYAGFLHGKVVDMFYFPIIRGIYPEWFPFVGGRQFIFFRPVFNIADSAITVGVIMLFFFQNQVLKHSKTITEKTAANEENVAEEKI